jgi:hypothetical protein
MGFNSAIKGLMVSESNSGKQANQITMVETQVGISCYFSDGKFLQATRKKIL